MTLMNSFMVFFNISDMEYSDRRNFCQEIISLSHIRSIIKGYSPTFPSCIYISSLEYITRRRYRGR